MCLVLLLLLLLSSSSFANDIPKTIEFRDGSSLRLKLPDAPLQWRQISQAGTVTTKAFPLEKVEQLHLVESPITEKIAAVRTMAEQLGHIDYNIREKSQKQLVKYAGPFREHLERFLESAVDPEIRWRLKQVVAALPRGGSLLDADYDLLQVSGGEAIAGDIGDWLAEADFHGNKLKIHRKNVLAIREAAPLAPTAPLVGVPEMKRIEEDKDENFPQEVVRIHFDHGPRGEELRVGQDVSQMFVPLGCRLSTSFTDSFVGIQSYNVGGRSGGNCAATQEPLYHGTLTLNFCVPGNSRLAAGVHYVGVWVSHVAPGGTSLVAYDARGRELASIQTVANRKDFLSFHLTQPIAYVEVVPSEIDPDFAIDDVVFDPPQPLVAATGGDRYMILLASGDRISCGGIEVDGDRLILKELSVGPAELELPLADVAAIAPPVKPAAPLPKTAMVLLRDGSRLRARGGKQFTLARFPETELQAGQVLAMWGQGKLPHAPTQESWQEQPAAVYFEKGKFRPLSEFTLGDKWLESKDLEKKDFTYENSPLVWFAPQGKYPAPRGMLQLRSGEDISLGSLFSLVSFTGEQVIIEHAGNQKEIPFEEIHLFTLP